MFRSTKFTARDFAIMSRYSWPIMNVISIVVPCVNVFIARMDLVSRIASAELF